MYFYQEIHYVECLFVILQSLLIIAWSIYISSALGGCRVVFSLLSFFFSFINFKISIRGYIHSSIICFFLACISYVKDKINNGFFSFSHFSILSWFPITFIDIQGLKKNCLGEVKGSTDLNILDMFQSKEDFFFPRYSLSPVEIFPCLFWSHFDMNSVYRENFVSVMKNTLD